jgi:hypothetical protein
VASVAKVRGGVLLLSDLLHPEDAAAALARLRASGFDVLAVEVATRGELPDALARAGAYAGSGILVDAETGEKRRSPFAPVSLERASRERAARGQTVAGLLARLGAARARLSWDRPEEEIGLALIEGHGARAAAARLAREHEAVLRWTGDEH